MNLHSKPVRDAGQAPYRVGANSWLNRDTGGAAADGAGGLARVWCRHGFPHHAADAATVRAAERCLETGALAGSLRRLLADQLEDLRRSVAVRSAA